MTDTMTRRAFIGGSAAATAAMLAGCGSVGASGGSSSASDEKQKLIVFAAASLTESLTKAGDSFASQESYEMSYNFDSSGTLKTQIENGAEAESGNDEGLDFIDHSTRFDILENKATLTVPEGNPKSIAGFDDLAERLAAHDVLLAMGNSDVPVGQYTQKILAWYGLDETELANAGCITYGTNVKEVTTQVSEGAVDCGVIYKTDATSAGLTVVDEATNEMCGRVVYPAAALKEAPNADGVSAFLEFLKGSEASADFEEVGFMPLS